MSTYNGQALVIGIGGNDASAPVTASLTSYREGLRTSWGGTLTPAQEGQPWLLNLTAGKLQLPDGTAAEFVRPDTSDLARTSRMKVIGQDDPPF